MKLVYTTERVPPRLARKYCAVQEFAPSLIFLAIITFIALLLTTPILALAVAIAMGLGLRPLWRNYASPRTLLYLRKFDPKTRFTLTEEVVTNWLPRYFRVLAIHDCSGVSNLSRRWIGASHVAAWSVALGFASFLGVGRPKHFTSALLLVVGVSLLATLIAIPIRRRERQGVVYGISDFASLHSTIGALWNHGKPKAALRRMFNVSVTHDIWRDSVQTLAEQADAIILDLSDLGEGLLWETEMMLSRFESKTVLVTATFQRGGESLWNLPASERLEAILQGRAVLAGRKSLLRTRFHSALKTMLLCASSP